MSNERFSLSSATNLFKIKYGKLSENVYNSANVLLARTKKSYDFVGKQKFIPVPFGFKGGVGSGTLPKTGTADYEDAILVRKKVYARAEIDRESIKAAMNDEGAFVRQTKHEVEKTVESYMRNMSRILFGCGDGKLGVIDAGGVVDNGGGNYTLTISAASWKEANWEERDLVNIETGNTDLFCVDSVDASAKEITVTRVTGSQVPTDADEVFMQGSEDNDPMGLKGALTPSDCGITSLYSIPVAKRRWQAAVKDAGGAGLTEDLMNEVMLNVEKQSGKTPNLIITSYTQYRKLLALLESKKEYTVEPRSPELKGKISFKAIAYTSTRGEIPVLPERFCEDDRMYFLNDNQISILHAPDFGWFDDDGTVFLRLADTDAFEARYGGYLEVHIVPSFHGVLKNLSVA